MKHQHREAFTVMKYATKDGSYSELIWNSRDGVTPFIIRSPDGREMSHVEWNRDQYAPEWIPEIGSRVFVDATFERCLEWARKWVDRYWDSDPEFRTIYSNEYGNLTKEEITRKHAEIEFSQHGAPPPDLLVVTAGFQEWLKSHRGSRAGGTKV
jgi:hypothetical protein